MLQFVGHFGVQVELWGRGWKARPSGRGEGGGRERGGGGKGVITYHQHGCLLQGTAATKCRSKSAHALLQPAPLPLPAHPVQTPAALGRPEKIGLEVGVELLAGGQGPGALHGLLWG